MKVYRNLSLVNTGQVIQARPCELAGYELYNAASAARYVKVYDKATAPDATDTPILTVVVPASSRAALYFSDHDGPRTKLGLGVRATTGLADSDNGAPLANEVIAHVYYR